MDVDERLSLFVKRAEELRDTTLVRSRLEHSITVRWNRVEGGSFMFRQPSHEELGYPLMLFRRFISPKEPIYIKAIHNLLYQRVIDEEAKRRLVHARKIWNDAHRSAGIALSINGEGLLPEQVADWWINGWYFHDDPKGMKMLQEIIPLDSIEGRVAFSLFLSFFSEGVNQVLWLRDMIVYLRKEGLVRL